MTSTNTQQEQAKDKLGKRFTTKIQPRFYETDGLGHIGNTVLPGWFESSRFPVFDALLPSIEVASWPFIIAHINVDFIRQIFVDSEVTVIARISRIGSSSFTVSHEAWQKEQLCARGDAVMVHFDYGSQKKAPIPEAMRKLMEGFLEE